MHLSNNLRGAAFMAIAMASFTLNDTCMKVILQDVPLFQAIAMRGLMTVALLAVLVQTMAQRRFLLPKREARIVGLRAMAEMLATFTFIAALAHMPLANLSAIFQALPFMVTLAAAVFLGDRIGWRRMVAIGIGFLGVLLIIRPGTAGFDVWSLMALASVATAVVRDLATRKLSHEVPTVTVAFWTALLVTVVATAVMAGQGWQTPTSRALWLFPVAAGCVVMGYLFIIKAMRVGEIWFVAPFRYTMLVWALFLGWGVFGDWPDTLTMLGAGVIVATGIFTIWRERKVRGTIPEVVLTTPATPPIRPPSGIA
jgi:drug/metabolite transporter (DMT)-like permease